MTLQLGQFPLLISENGAIIDDIYTEPFHYELDITKKDDTLIFKARCENIPCSMCIIESSCKGKTPTESLVSYAKEHLPELFL